MNAVLVLDGRPVEATSAGQVVPGGSGLLLAVALLAAGTLAFRLAGPLLVARLPESAARWQPVIDRGVAVVFVALVVTSTLLDGRDAAGVARPAGVLAAGLLAWRGRPFVVVVLAAALVTAALRLAGVP